MKHGDQSTDRRVQISVGLVLDNSIREVVSMKKIHKIFCLCILLGVMFNLAACGRKNDLSEVEKMKELIGLHEWEYTDSDDEPLNGYVSLGQTFQYYDGSVYFLNGNGSVFIRDNLSEVTTMKRLNVETGNITNVCPDPLCSHTTASCPFAGKISSFFIDESDIIYIRSYVTSNGDKSIGVRQFCSYDLKNMEFTAHITEDMISGVTTSQYNKMLYHDDKCYYYDYIHDEETNKYHWILKKLDLETNQVKTIGDSKFYDDGEGNPFAEEFLFIVNDRIYFKNINTIYSTTVELTDKQVHSEGVFVSNNIYTNGKYIFYGIPEGNEITENIYRIDLDGNNKIDLGIKSTNDWFLTTEYIYYYNPNYFELETANRSGTVSFFNDSMKRCDHDGKMKEDVFIADHSNKDKPELYLQLSSNIVVGNYIYSTYYLVSDDNLNGLVDDGEYYQSSSDFYKFNIMRININTGERSYLYINQE